MKKRSSIYGGYRELPGGERRKLQVYVNTFRSGVLNVETGECRELQYSYRLLGGDGVVRVIAQEY